VFVDASLLPVWEKVAPNLETVEKVVVMGGEGSELDYEGLLEASSPDFAWPALDEHDACAMCYTSGTTGDPKGVVYSHRSMVLHAMALNAAACIGLTDHDAVLPVVPMFHANAWGLAHAAVFAGADLVFPGPDLSPPAIVDLIESERVTVAAGVPTIWMGVLPLLEGRDVSSLRAIPCGGSAVPKSLSEGFRAATGMPILQAWGMTETSPVASVCRVKSTMRDQSDDALADLRATQGIPVPGVDARIVAPDSDDELAWDGVTSGELQVRGPWIAATYYDDPRADESFTKDGWLRTGDVAVVSPEGYIRLVDRTKDLVKSGGEWISSVELENEIMAHPKVAEAAVIGVPHERWVERPLACVVIKPGESLTKAEVLEFLGPRVAKWWLPDDVVFIDEVPKTSVGKFSKKTLRDRFADHRLPTA